MLKVIFRNSKGQERTIGEAKDRQEANQIMKQFMDEHNFTSYYTREWKAEGRIWLDVGSWSEFMILEEE